jgi:phosphoglycolate phosphatase-like HAD superfamily hydrolase
LKKKNLIVFDIDGTLTDSVKVHQKAFTEMLLEIGVRQINAEYKSFMHHTDSYISKEIFETDRNEKFSAKKNIEFENGLYKKIKSQEILEILGAKKLIEYLDTNSDFGICFATGSLRRPAIHKLESIGVKFDESLLVASDNIYEREEIVKRAIVNAQAFYNMDRFERTISLGDGLWDLKTAKQLNIEFIGIGDKNREVLINNGAELVFDNLLDINMFSTI